MGYNGPIPVFLDGIVPLLEMFCLADKHHIHIKGASIKLYWLGS